MSLEPTLRVLNSMEAAHVIGRYAIGGAVAAFFYIEPGTTFDLDIFIVLEPSPSGLLDLSTIYSHLAKLGYLPRGEAVAIKDWDVQFLPAHTALEAEALREAVEIQIGGVSTRVFTQEHLMAICLRIGRPKDLARLVAFVEHGEFSEPTRAGIFARHDLVEKWVDFLRRYFSLS